MTSAKKIQCTQNDSKLSQGIDVSSHSILYIEIIAVRYFISVDFVSGYEKSTKCCWETLQKLLQ